jgi:DNA polymerase-3 subunit beta
VSVSISETKIKMQHGTTTIVSKVIDGTFPDYTRVIPDGNQNKVTVSALEMKIASNRVASVSSERAPSLKMDVGTDGVVLSVAGSDGNTARDEVSGSLDGMPLTIGFNAKYMVEAMAMCNGDDVVIEMKDAGSPALMHPSEDDRFMIVLMPMRV